MHKTNICFINILPMKSKHTLLSPSFAIIIPVYKHSVFVSEAITSAISQETEFPFRIVIINDGCPYPETHQVCLEFALANPHKVIYVRQKNKGLSNARNTGIDFVLKAWPKIEAVYLLDADNRLFPSALDRAFRYLRNHPDADWIYPSIDMFGLENNYEYSGDYSILRHLEDNTCEAGSLIHRRVLESGLRFDENMKEGYEDWEFWLQACEKGFRGRNLPEFGFQYRKRPESMVKDTQRQHNSVISYIRKKHSALFFSHRALVNIEHYEDPRYAIYLSESSKFILTSDPCERSNQITVFDFINLYGKGLKWQTRYSRPPFLFFSHSATLEQLETEGLLQWAFWYIEDKLDLYNIVFLSVGQSEDENKIEFKTHESWSCFQQKEGLIAVKCSLFDNCIADNDNTWLMSIFSKNPEPSIYSVNVRTPKVRNANGFIGDVGLDMVNILLKLESIGLTVNDEPSWEWRTNVGTRRDALYKIVRDKLEAKAVCPRLIKSNDRQVGFILPMVSFGGVEKCAFNISEVLKDNGWTPHLFVFDRREMHCTPEWEGLYESINFLDDPHLCYDMHSQELCMGMHLHRPIKDFDQKRALGLLSGMDLVINFHSIAVNSLLGSLKSKGITTASSIHLLDLTKYGRITGHPYFSLIYEHALDIILCHSQQLLDWCHAMGVPLGKLVLVPNAPSYSMDQEEIKELMIRRSNRSKTEPLHMLYLGRLDHQKGLDRLLRVIELTKNKNINITWRVVGSAIIQDSDDDFLLSELKGITNIEPPIFDTDRLTEVFEWADILFMPSYWEGLPLTILEAMRTGTVVCAADVGAIREAVEDGSTGYLLPNLPTDAFSEFCCDLLDRLSNNRDKLKQVSLASVNVSKNRTWENSCTGLLDIINNKVRTPEISLAAQRLAKEVL